MKDLTGLIGRGELVEKAVKEIRKGRHVILTGNVGVGKSALLETLLERVERRRGERQKVDSRAPGERQDPRPAVEQRKRRQLTLVHVVDHQAKGQFIAIARRLLAVGILSPQALELPEHFHAIPPPIEWAKIKRHVNRLSIRDLTAAIIPAIHDHPGKVIIAVDDLTQLTPTMTAFWLAIMDKAQVIGGASQKKKNLAKLWWKMTEIEVPPLSPDATREIVKTYITQQGMLIESPALFVEHVVKQSGGNAQAIHDMLDDAAKEKVVDKRKIRAMKHAAGVRYLDFTPVVIVGTACIVGARYLAMGTGDTALYIGAGMLAAVVFSLRFLLFRGAGKAN